MGHSPDLGFVYCPLADGAHTLTCALMLLNTDLHGHVRTEMSEAKTAHVFQS